MTAGPTRLPRLPFVLLGLMTLFSFGGPVVIAYAIRGGNSADWPPDRPIEWATFGAISGMVGVLMLACLSLGLTARKQVKRATTDQADRPGVEP